MNPLLNVLRELLLKTIDDIDAGNSNFTEEELDETVEVIKRLSDRQKPMTKYQASNYIHVSRATFDNLVKEGKLPEGKKLYQGDSNIFWYRKDLDNYLNNKKYGKV